MSVLFVFFVIAGITRAQDSTFKVTSFIPEKFKDVELKLDAGWDYDLLNQDKNEKDSEYGNNYLRENFTNTSGDTIYFSPSYRFYYWSIRNSIDYNARLRFDVYKENIDDTLRAENSTFDDIESESRSDQNSFVVTVEQDVTWYHYFRRNMFAGCYAQFDMEYNDTDSDENYHTNNDYGNYIYDRISEQDYFRYKNGYDGMMEFHTGIGRIYEGYFAAKALYIIDELNSQGYLDRLPDHREYSDLAELIYEYDQKHIIDSRIHRIEALSAILDYLAEENLIDENSYKSALYIQDVWDYYPDDRRKFGSRFTLGVGGEYHFSREKSRRTGRTETVRDYYSSSGEIDSSTTFISDIFQRNNIKNTTEGIYLLAEYEYHRPINLKWQARLALSAQYEPYRIAEFENNYYNPNYGLTKRRTDWDYRYNIRANLRFTNFISSRSTLSIYCGFNIGSDDISTYFTNVSDEAHLISSVKNTTYLYGPKFELSHRISIPTTLTLKASYLRYNSKIDRLDNADNDTDYNTLALSISISHYIL